MTQSQIDRRYDAAREIARKAGDEALRYFRVFDTLDIDRKGHQDLVSEGDRNVELLVRGLIETAFPQDAIVGEEHAPKPGTSGFTWVIDPIDGTANFVRGIPVWAVVIAVVEGAQTVIGVTHDPVHDEMSHARRGGGAFVNDRRIHVAQNASLSDGSVGVGFSGRTRGDEVLGLMRGLIERGGVFYRNASGAISLAFVAQGKLLGYAEAHMNAWDCMAGQLLVHEAGGLTEDQDARRMIADGGRVIVGAPEIFAELTEICERAFSPALT